MKAPSKSVYYYALEEMMELLYQQQTLQPVIMDRSGRPITKKYYKAVFGGDLSSFFQSSLQEKKDENGFDLQHYLLDFVIDVIKHDYVWQNKSSKMVELLCKERASFVMKSFKESKTAPRKKYTLHKLVNMLSMFMADMDVSNQSRERNIIYLKTTDSDKVSFSLSVYRNIFKEVKSIKELFIKSFLIRPTWLSTLVLIKALQKFPNQGGEPIEICDELKEILRELPGGAADKVAKADPNLQVMLMYYLHQSLPIAAISRTMLINCKGLSSRGVKAMTLNLKNPKEFDRSVIFDNNVGMKSKNLSTEIRKCVDLFNKFKISRTVDRPHQVWHFL